MSLRIVRKIACEHGNSEIVPRGPRNELQRIRLNRLYELLAVLRIFLTLNMQTGWIHQDEFSNSIEVIADKYFNLQVMKTPDFNATFPTRSTIFLHATVCLPYLFGHHFLTSEHPLGKESIPNSRALIMIPRILQVCLSFLVDFIMIKFCALQKRNRMKQNGSGSDSNRSEDAPQISAEEDGDEHSFHLITLATSQVLLIFTSRTHSSAINLILFSALLYFVSDSLHRMEEYIPILNKYHKTDGKKDPQARVILLRQLKATGYSPIQKLHWIALLVTVGLFNDPDFFLSFAVVPIFFYLHRGIRNPYIGMTHFHTRCFMFLLYLFGFSVPFVLWDSFYYGKVTYQDFNDLHLSTESFTIIPVNYFLTHGLPFRNWWLMVKIFATFGALFNVLGLIGLVSFFKELYDIFFSEWKFKPKLDSQWTFLNCSLFLPLLLLIRFKSAFDLAPLIFPLTAMHGHKIPLVSRFNKKICLSWFIFNLVGVLYWGYLSRGGILTSFLDLYDKLLPIRFNETQVDIILVQMSAIPPTFVLAIPSFWKSLVHLQPEDEDNELDPDFIPKLPKTVLKLETDSKIRVFHTGLSEKPLQGLEGELFRLIRKNSNSDYAKGLKANLVLLPTEMREEVQHSFKILKFYYLKTYWNHVEMDWLFSDQLGQEQHLNTSIGLDIYRLEPFKVKGSERVFESIFQFKSDYTHFLTYFVNSILSALATFWFVMSYMAFLM